MQAVNQPKATWLGWGAVAILLAGLYSAVAPRLVRQWATDDDYTHGFLILPLALYFVWDERERLKGLSVKPSLWGAGLLAFGLVMLVVGSVGAELFLQRSSFVVVLAGLVWLILGTAVPARAGLSPRVPRSSWSRCPRS